MPDKKRVLILCTGNSAEAKWAEGLLRDGAGDRFEVFSAGTKPSQVRPEAIAAMEEVGIDISDSVRRTWMDLPVTSSTTF